MSEVTFCCAMETSSTNVNPDGGSERPWARSADRAHETVAVAGEFIEELSAAESINLRERLGRLEASIAFWATDLEDLNAENERICAERDALSLRLQQAEEGQVDAEDARATLEVVLADRDERIRILETGLLEAEQKDVEALSTRARLQSLRKRVRERMTSQSGVIKDLRSLLKLGHAAQLQAERELQGMRDDARRNARYLDRLEEKLNAASGD